MAMDWAWLFEQGLIEGDLAKYENNELQPTDINHAVQVAYKAANPEQRRILVDMLWENGLRMQGQKEYWYDDRSSEVADLAAAFSGVRPEQTRATSDFTDDPDTRFNGLPGHPELWKDTTTGEIWVVYYPTGLQTQVPLLYKVTSEEVARTYFGDKDLVFDRELTSGEIMATGAVAFGDVGDIEDAAGDPWAGFQIKMDRARKAMPWLADPDVFAIVAAAYLEGREVNDYEFVGTKWWDTHNEAEREWLTKVCQDPATAMQTLSDNRSTVAAAFKAMGMAVPADDVLDYINQQWTQGTWSKAYMDDQILILSGGGEGLELDSGLAEITGSATGSTSSTVGSAEGGTTYVDQVKELWSKWLGPAYPPTDKQVQEWAGIFRDDPTGGRARLTEMLRGQRLALFPEYEDDTLTWDDIAGPWAGMAYNIWGVAADQTDPRFQEIVRMNNATEAAKMMRQIGLDEGYTRVLQSAANALDRGMTRNVRGVV